MRTTRAPRLPTRDKNVPAAETTRPKALPRTETSTCPKIRIGRRTSFPTALAAVFSTPLNARTTNRLAGPVKAWAAAVPMSLASPGTAAIIPRDMAAKALQVRIAGRSAIPTGALRIRAPTRETTRMTLTAQLARPSGQVAGPRITSLPTRAAWKIGQPGWLAPKHQSD